ncbi:biotin synthase BioB [Verrucomicrobia bacterium]|jgi:biotin synthase|nr:biotin synthase BioB [bacterium]MDA7627656.1 biotin synthase BioB [Verrucomicrobiota bacterium]MDA7665717.1 biotin synthase BioB [Verrucomicrobiota bacterium]MDB4626312.1 biotin synthase BioB [bacterium]MDB4744734.1 biotin synthase BioB [Verrucomicrobiota bacterium]
MKASMVDVTNRDRIHALADRIMAGGSVDRDEALWMFHLESQADITDLMSAANRLREHFKGNKIHLCSIVNAKAGGCSENCKFCSQSAAYTTESPRYGFIDPEPVSEASKEAEQNNVTAVGLVAAWKGLREGPVLDEVCDRIREMAADGKVRPDASLGLIDSQQVADRLKDAGLACYGHNLESSRRFFPEHCTTHTFEDRLQTIKYLKNAGIKICSGGIIGMGETREDRCDMAMQLREIGASVVPVNFLNPIEGTPYETMKPLAPMEILKTIACFRFILPQQEIMVAGGRTVNLRDLQSMVFMAGASALMVGNYLTTLNQPAEQDLQMLKDLGLDPDWEPHEDMESDGCGSNDACGCASKEEPVTA